MTAIHRRGPGDIWQGLWEPYLIADEAPGKIPDQVRNDDEVQVRNDGFVIPSPEGAKESHSLLPVATNVRHQLTHQTIHADLWLCETPERPDLPEDFIWIPESALPDYALPRLVQILLADL